MNPLFVPGGIYRNNNDELVEYISTFGKNENDRQAGLRFYNIASRKMETIPPDKIGSVFPHAAAVNVDHPPV